MTIKAHYPDFTVWAGAQAYISRVLEIWRDCLKVSDGPYLFGQLSMADAMYAPVCLRFRSSDVMLDPECQAHCDKTLAWPALVQWIEQAKNEPDELEELDAEFRFVCQPTSVPSVGWLAERGEHLLRKTPAGGRPGTGQSSLTACPITGNSGAKRRVAIAGLGQLPA